MTGFTAFGLQAPARLLYPGGLHDRNSRDRTVKLGTEDDAATLVILEWDRCRVGCKAVSSHDAGRSVRLLVPCDARPHCGSCECTENHYVVISDEQLTQMKAILP